jgi:hypothetical protein
LKDVKIYVLSGGFNGWLKAYNQEQDRSLYIEEYDASQWRNDGQNNYLHKLDSAFLDFASSV